MHPRVTKEQVPLLLLLLTLALLFYLLSTNIAAASRVPEKDSSIPVATLKVANESSLALNNTQVDINPHWDQSKCGICHLRDTRKVNRQSDFYDVNEICLKCHSNNELHAYIHPVQIVIPEKYVSTMHNNWSYIKSNDNLKILSCDICHDVLDQCLEKRSYMKNINSAFLREGPYRNRTAICFKCHDTDSYKQLVAHDQINSDKTLKLSKCRLCHKKIKSKIINKGIQRDIDKYPLINNLNHDRALLCIRCHKKIDHPTSGMRVSSDKTYRHFQTITDEKYKTLKMMTKSSGIPIPLEPVSGRIYCGTCHDAHEPGVFRDSNNKISKLAPHRLRAKKICSFCHEK